MKYQSFFILFSINHSWASCT